MQHGMQQAQLDRHHCSKWRDMSRIQVHTWYD
ncbi:hypothetical protein HaLaN_28376, partial [Haematococcus lacustris]